MLTKHEPIAFESQLGGNVKDVVGWMLTKHEPIVFESQLGGNANDVVAGC
jgi:hypothetical protein